MTARGPGGALRVAFLVYRGNPHCGGQGVYTRHLTRELAALGHRVTVLSGQPYPELVDGVELVRVPSLDLYREPDPFRRPRAREIESATDALELATMLTGGFPEPRTFSLRAARVLAPRRDEFDLVHDDQSLGTGLLRLLDARWPVVASVHHPVEVDRELDLEHVAGWARRAQVRRWYGFSAMQARVARRLPEILTVSRRSRDDIVSRVGVDPARVSVVPVGVDPALHRPLPGTGRVPGLLMTTASADMPLKGLVPLLEALAKVRTDHPEARLVVVGRLRERSPVAAVIERLGLARVVEFVGGESDEQLVERYARASVAVVPSLYEGFSLPAAEAMACGVPLVATSGGAIPEVVGEDRSSALVVPPGDVEALACAIRELLDDAALAGRIAAAGRARVLARFTWRSAALGTVERYEALLDGRPRPAHRALPC
ncbi:MAG: glycosyltransferase family 4 protein [Actinomycetota bacterium]|nr:glycosyltransferase family 4 protein [Actinomycetota bacterium]